MGQHLAFPDAGVSADIDLTTGRYEVRQDQFAWKFAGQLDSELRNPGHAYNEDTLGLCDEYSFDYGGGTRRASIRFYYRRPIVLFTDEYLIQAENRGGFPSFREYPRLAHHLAYAGFFASATFTELPPDSPWQFFDDLKRTWILSPVLRPNVERQWISPAGELICGVDKEIQTIRAGSKFYTLLALGSGMNATMNSWGEALAAVAEKKPLPADADVVLRKIGYWTDNGGAYYYRSDPGKSYTETFLALQDEFTSKGARLGYVQLDSWHYPKGARADWTDHAGGIWEYRAAPELFPGGLKDLHERLQLPLVVHARWIDPASPYRTRYKMSRNVVIDLSYYQRLAEEFRQQGVAVYEQDWLGTEAKPETGLDAPNQFFSNMASQLKDFGIQYCMALPRQILKSVEFPNVTSVRGSRDRLQPATWQEFHYASRLIRSAGKWPFADVFQSSETGNLLVSLLSAGPVGIGDAIGRLDSRNLRRAARADGVLVKPDVPAVPTDESVLADANGGNQPMIVSSHTQFKGYKAWYVFAYSRGGAGEASLTPASLGAKGPVFVLDYLSGSGSIRDASDRVELRLKDDMAYLVVYPILESGLALFGDLEHSVPLGRTRVTEVQLNGEGDRPGSLTFDVDFAAGESERTVLGYAAAEPAARAIGGSIREFSYDSVAHIFFAALSPDTDGKARVDIAAGH